MTVTRGYVGTELVIAFEYDGLDAGLNHYTFKGVTYAGTVKFDYVVSKKLEP